MKNMENDKHVPIIITALFIGALLMLAVGVYGFYSLYEAGKNGKEATGVVERVDRHITYKYRKRRYSYTVYVRYETEEYGSTLASEKVYLALGLTEGSRVSIIYNAKNPFDICLAARDRWIYGGSCAVGLLLGWCVARLAGGGKGKENVNNMANNV